MTNVSGKSAHYLLASCTDPGFPSLDLLPQAHHHALGTVTQSVLPASLVYEMLWHFVNGKQPKMQVSKEKAEGIA